MAKIQKIKDNQDVLVYPLTHERAVIDSFGVKLEDKLNNVLVRTYTELTPTAVESKAFEPDGSIIDATTTTLKTFSVTGGNEYAFSWYAAKTYTRYALAWYDANSTYISKESYKGNNSSSVTYTEKIVKAPTGAAYAKMNISNSFVSRAILYSVTTLKQQTIYENTVFKTDIVDSLDSTATDKPLSANRGRILYDALEAGKAVEYEYIEPDQISEDKAILNLNDGIVDSQYHDLYTYVVQEGKDYAFNGYRTTTITTYILYWGDSEGNMISREPYKGVSSEVRTFFHVKATAPAGATRAYINAQHGWEGFHAFYDAKTVTNESIGRETQVLDSFLGVRRCPYAILSTGLFDTSADVRYGHLAIKVQPGERYHIKNSQPGTGDSHTRYAFATSDAYEPGGSVPFVTGYSIAILEKGASITATIPDGCSYLLVNAPLDYPQGSYPIIEKLSDATASRKVIRLLSIGNSYSEDALAYVPFILQNMGVDAEIKIGILMKSSAGLEEHVDCFNNERNAYTFQLYNGGTAWQSFSSKSIQWALDNYQWDIISLQQSSQGAFNWSTYQPWCNQLINLVSEYVGYPIKFIWYQPQARPASTNSGSNWSDATITSHYEATAAASQRVLNETVCEVCVPVGTAIQNARSISTLKALGDYASNANNTSDLGYLTPNDGVHLQEGLPCQIAAYTFILALLDIYGLENYSINGESTRVTSAWESAKNIPHPHGNPIGSTDANCLMAQKCAIMAHKHPFEVTDMTDIVNTNYE